MLVADDQQLHALDQLAAINAPRPSGRGRAERAAVHHHRRGQDLVTLSQAPVQGQAPAQPAPQPEPGPAGEGAVQGGEGDTREPAGDAPLHAAEGQGPDQPDQAPTQREVRLAAAAVHADPLALHGLQLGLDREDEHLEVGQGVPAVAAPGSGDATGGGRKQIGGAGSAGARHRLNMVSPSLGCALCARTAPTTRTHFAYSFLPLP